MTEEVKTFIRKVNPVAKYKMPAKKRAQLSAEALLAEETIRNRKDVDLALRELAVSDPAVQQKISEIKARRASKSGGTNGR